MRDEGRGWGEIAKEFDVHPKYLGLGHFKHETKYATQTKHGSKNTTVIVRIKIEAVPWVIAKIKAAVMSLATDV